EHTLHKPDPACPRDRLFRTPASALVEYLSGRRDRSTFGGQAGRWERRTHHTRSATFDRKRDTGRSRNAPSARPAVPERALRYRTQEPARHLRLAEASRNQA